MRQNERDRTWSNQTAPLNFFISVVFTQVTDERLVEKVQSDRNSPSGRRLDILKKIWTKSSMLFYFVNYNVWIRVSWIIGPVFCGDTKSYKHWGSSFLSFPVDLRRVRVQTLLGIFKSLITKPHNRLSLNCISEMRLPLQDKKSLMLWPTFHEMWLANCAPCQQSSPDLAPEKHNSRRPHSGTRKIPRGHSLNVFSMAKKARPNKAWKLAYLCVERGQGFVE